MTTTRNICLVTLALLAFAGIAAAQPGDGLPPRAFQRFGTFKLRHGSRILCLAYSHDGQILAAGGGNDPLRLWNPKTGEVIREINEPWVHAIALTETGKTLVFGGYQKNIRLWSLELNKEIGRFEGHKATIKAISVSPDISKVASGSQDGAIKIWDWNTKSQKPVDLVGHTDEVNALAYSPDKESNLLASAGSDRFIILWNTATDQSIGRIDAGCCVQAIAFSADGKTLYSAGDDNLIRRWDVAGRKQTGTFKGHEGMIVSLIVQGDTLISGALDKTIRFWDAKTTELKRTLPRGQGDCDALAVTKAGDFVATAGLNNTIRIFEAANGKEVHPASGPQSALLALALSSDNKRLAGIAADGQIFVVDAAKTKVQRQWDSKQTGEFLLAFAADNKTLACASTTVKLWNTDTGDEIADLPIKALDSVVSLAFSPDGKTLALGMRGAQIDLWDVKEKKVVGAVKYPGSLFAVAWSPDGKRLAGAGGAKVYVWNARTKELEKAFDVKEVKEGPTPTFPLVKLLAFGPDSKTLAAGGFDATIRIYNINAKNPTDPREQRLCEGHVSAIYALAFSADGRTLISGSYDKTVRLWEAFSGKQIALYKGHLGEVMGVAFMHDGRSVFSAGADTTIFRWDVPGLNNDGTLPKLTLGPQELDSAWTTLTTEETPKGHETTWRCIASAKQAVPHLTKDLYTVDPERVKKLFRDLDSSHYPTRFAAQNELTKYGRWMEGRYDAAIQNPPSLEYKRRVEMLKEKVIAANAPTIIQERLRVRRIMLMCEQVGSPEAIEALRKLADRGPEEELREEAQASLKRLNK